MGRIVGMVRFIVGAAMVAGGVTLVIPFARLVVAAVETSGHAAAVPALGAAPALVSPPAAAPAATNAAAAPQAGWLVPEGALPPAVELRGDYVPPRPPEPLPGAPAALGAEGPGMNGNYRSTLSVPPPPLLDAHAPPPQAGPVIESPLRSLPPAATAAVAPPPTYVIRDGDDLTGIAIRFYGHPAAAPAVWAANRDMVPDPALLPIGATLRMPPPWSIPGLPGSATQGTRSIEPPPATAGPKPPPAAVAPASWLVGGPAPAATAAAPAVPPSGIVRLAPGETLESLAVRFYGDRSAAARIWEANRDRLRSPELAVTGMELRLP